MEVTMDGQKRTFFQGQSEGGNLPGPPSIERSENAGSFVVFSLGGEAFAVAIEKVREIIRVPHMTWVPGSSELVRGVINLRGNVVAVIDLAGILSLPAPDESALSRIIVVDFDGDMVGMLVDSVSQVAEIVPSVIEPALGTLDEKQKKFVVSQSNQDNTMIGILDLQQIINEARAAQPAI